MSIWSKIKAIFFRRKKNELQEIKENFQEESYRPYPINKRKPFTKPVTTNKQEKIKQLIQKQEELGLELKQVAEELKQLKQEEQPETQEEEKKIIEIEDEYKDFANRIIKYIPAGDIKQMTLSEFQRVMRSPTIHEKSKYGLNIKGFGAQPNDLIKKIHEYIKNK